MTFRPLAQIVALAAVLALGACHKPPHDARADAGDINESVGEDMMVDPALAHGETGKRHGPEDAALAGGPGEQPRPRHAHEPAPKAPPPPPAAPRPSPAPPPIKAVAAKAPPPVKPVPVVPPAQAKPADAVAATPAPHAPSKVAAAKPAPKPVAAPVAKAAAAKPAATAAPARVAAAKPAGACLTRLGYGRQWAGMLPAALPLYPNAKLTESAGNDGPGCDARAASFTAAVPPKTLIDWYRGKATGAGYSAEIQQHGKDMVLAGTGAGDSAYFLTFSEAGRGGTQVDLVANGIR